MKQSDAESGNVNQEYDPLAVEDIDWDEIPFEASSFGQLKQWAKQHRSDREIDQKVPDEGRTAWAAACLRGWRITGFAPERIRWRPPNPIADLPRLRAVAMFGAEQIRNLAAQPVNWVWDGYIVEGSIVGLVGKSSGGKTTLAFLLIVARASAGYSFNGRMLKPAPDGKYIVLIENEHSSPSTARKLMRSAQLLGLSEARTNAALNRLIVVSRKSVQLDSPEWQDVCKLIEAGLVSDVILDTLASSSNGDSNSEKEQGELFDRLKRGLEKAPNGECPTAWVVMHTRKEGAQSLEDISGSAQRGAQLDSCILVTPKRAQKSQQVIGSEVKLIKQREDSDDLVDAFEVTITKGSKPTLIVVAQAATTGDDYVPSDADLEKIKAVCRAVGEENWESSRARYGANASMVIKLQDVRNCKDPKPGIKANRIKPCLERLVELEFLVRDEEYDTWFGPGLLWDSSESGEA